MILTDLHTEDDVKRFGDGEMNSPGWIGWMGHPTATRGSPGAGVVSVDPSDRRYAGAPPMPTPVRSSGGGVS